MTNRSEELRELLSWLSCDGTTAACFRPADLRKEPDSPEAARIAELLEQPDERVTDLVEAMQDLLEKNPRKVLGAAPAHLGASATPANFNWLFEEARRHLEAPALTLEVLKRNQPQGSSVGAELADFPGRDDTEIEITPRMRTFETLADAGAWAITAVQAAAFRVATSKPTLPPHTVSDTHFRYPLVTRNGEASVALFSDWGTGYYHSAYIAKHIAELGAQQAVHLGDVYYTGGLAEFRERFDPWIDKYILPRMPFFAMNANHEMDSHGIAYFDHLRSKRARGGQDGRPAQPQEGSYFCLYNDHYQVIGIDTAYWRNGRCPPGRDEGCDLMREWLETRLREGRAAGRINILLSQNEPWVERTTKLFEDLAFVLQPELVDLWFWGDQHFCALYPPSNETPFVGSCIGHGGYPYSVKSRRWFGRHKVVPEWCETAPRFHLRKDRGNNGFCLLEAAPDQLRLRYVDWRRNARCTVDIPVHEGRLDWAGRTKSVGSEV
ncbi:MAG: metallophosphoesterase [Myxococcaceae bacterium]